MKIILIAVVFLVGGSMVFSQEMVLISPGRFEMGLDPGEKLPMQVYKKYTPRHEVSITKPFLLSRAEVTFAEFYLVLNWGVAQGKVWKFGNTYALPWFGRVLVNDNDGIVIRGEMITIKKLSSEELLELPVVMVSWYSAIAYCNLKSEMEGLTPCYDLSTGNFDLSRTGYRLPTEAEWVWAYRGAAVSEKYLYAGSDVPSEAGWNSSNTSGLQPARRLKPNELGLFDMSGNVYEWINDWMSYFPSTELIDPEGPVSQENVDGEPAGKVVLGGSWNFGELSMRSDLRSGLPPEIPYFSVGFRIARTQKP